jgi:hypothetical protein
MQRSVKRLSALLAVLFFASSLLLSYLMTDVMAAPAQSALAQQATATPVPTATLIPVVSRPVTLPVPTFMPVLFRDYRPQAPILGMALEGFFDEAGLRETLAVGARWGRRWREIAWRDIEPNEGDYRWEMLANLENELKRARAVGLEPILEIQLSPPWAQLYPTACGPIRADKFGAFAAFMEELVKRYGSQTEYGVRYWQLGNEADIDYRLLGLNSDSLFGCWGVQEDEYFGGGHYAEMLKVVYPRMKAADPGAVVMMSGLLLECDPYTMEIGVDCRNEERWKSGFFLEGVMQAGGGDYFDIADVHAYADLRMELPARMHSYYAWSGPNGGTGLPEKVAFVRGVMAKYGHGNKPIFAGEVGLKCDDPGPDCEQTGAAAIPRIYAEAYNLGLLGATYYALISEFKYKGLLREDLTPKPQYHAYEFMAGQLHRVEHVGPVTDYAGVTGAEFKRSGIRSMQIIWSISGTDQTITLPSDFVDAFDYLGRRVTPADNQLVVGWAPIYIELKIRNR